MQTFNLNDKYKKNGIIWQVVMCRLPVVASIRLTQVNHIAKTSSGEAAPESDESEDYEVMLLKFCEAADGPWGKIPAHYQMPTNEQWGSRGWAYQHWDDAKIRFYSLVENPKNATRSLSDIKGEYYTKYAPGKTDKRLSKHRQSFWDRL